jgi:hypothetical protein
MTTTFVSAFISLDESRPVDKSVDRYFNLFNQLQWTGIRIHLFLSPNYRGKVTLTNGIIEYISLKELNAYKNAPSGLPEYRNALHDTRNFLILMNSKVELVKRAMDSQMHSSTHFGWIDFGICHMFRTLPSSLTQIRQLGKTALPTPCMLIPGCWNQQEVALSHVSWRFCGSLFIGDRASIEEFHQRHTQVYPTLPHLTWEVNVWAHMESLGWSPTWYKADHDDSIVWTPYTSGIVRVPSKVPLYWAGGYSSFYPASAIEQFVVQSIQYCSPSVSVVFSQSDGLIGEEAYSQLSDTHHATTRAEKEFEKLESSARLGTTPIVAMLCTRQFNRPNLLLLPLDDDTFNRGLTAVLQPFHSPKWEDRKSIAFWRGGSSGCDRPTIRMRVAESLKDVSHADVKFTPGGWPENDALIPKDQFVPERSDLAKHFEYKYIFILDGNCIASAHQWVFGSGSVPIMITHPDNEYWFKKYLVPMVHYVPIQYDLSDLHEKLQWLVDHDNEAKKIAEHAMKFSKTVFSSEFQKAYVKSEVDRLLGGSGSLLNARLATKTSTPSDINEHLSILYNYAKRCTSIVECGVLEVTSSYAFASGLLGTPNNSLTMIDPLLSENMEPFLDICNRENINAAFLYTSDLACDPIETDLLFIDSWHVYAQLKRELAHWHSSVKKYILIHDTTVDEWYGESVRGNADAERQSRETGFPVEEIRKGLWPAIVEFLRTHSEWKLTERFTNNNGLTVLSRVSD